MTKEKLTTRILSRQAYAQINEETRERKKILKIERSKVKKQLKNLGEELKAIISDKELIDFLGDEEISLGEIGYSKNYDQIAPVGLELQDSKFILYCDYIEIQYGGNLERCRETPLWGVSPKKILAYCKSKVDLRLYNKGDLIKKIQGVIEK